MSGSGSDSGSFSSSEAIVAHFDEAAGSLAEGGYAVSEHAWDSITRALLEGTIDEISFWGVDQEGRTHALLRLTIDWRKHAVTIQGGDSVELPLKDGTVNLRQVRRAAEGFLRAFHGQQLTSQIRLNYCTECQPQREELNKRYGWCPGTSLDKQGTGAGWSMPSRYHPAVGLEVWFRD